ncbi:MAG: nucleotide sugar dehydrogenase [Acidimicrobiia bacterium]|nr:nucleotide sugar dehydrogenase [Acidimicrobiia bacterium]
MANKSSVVIVGGCGRVGLPLGLALAGAGHPVVLYDIDATAVDTVSAAKMPFDEEGADALLEATVANGLLRASTDRTVVAGVDHVIVVVGTPVDEHFNPDAEMVIRAVEDITDQLRSGQHLVLRSTVYPGVTALVERVLDQHDLDLHVSYCPERIAEGKALTELYSLPQIVSGRTPEALASARELFGSLADQIVVLDVEEAELAKLITNTWRYIKFAAANQLYMIANDFGLDYERIRQALAHDYPRAADLPGAGLAAGPCLLKDTMQLAAFNRNNFSLGHASMQINEGLPLYLVDRIEQSYDLSDMTVGLLGMAFKAGSDDTRESLSYKLKRLLRLRARQVLCTDPLVTTDPDLMPLEDVLAQSELLVIAAPHRQYADLAPEVPVIDVWNLLGQGVRV